MRIDGHYVGEGHSAVGRVPFFHRAHWFFPVGWPARERRLAAFSDGRGLSKKLDMELGVGVGLPWHLGAASAEPHHMGALKAMVAQPKGTQMKTKTKIRGGKLGINHNATAR